MHPFAEEMNKSRRMAALQASALASAGYAVLQLDLLGCGDSSGEFHEASWDGWIQDLVLGAQWLQSRFEAPLLLWGLRSGALLAGAGAGQLAGVAGLLLWQPTASGKTTIQQFLRLRAVADMAQAGGKGALQQLRAELDSGNSVEVAGYLLPASIAKGLESASLQVPQAQHRVAWLEVSTREGAELLPASAALIKSWNEQGVDVQSHVVNGPAFWQTLEIEDAPALISATVAAVAALLPETAP